MVIASMEIFPEDTKWYDLMLPLMLAGTMILGWINGRKSSVLVSIIYRWLLWITSATCAAYLSFLAGWFEKPFWVLYVVFFLAWFLAETVYYWVAIKALSNSSVSMFSSYNENPQGEEWPAQKRFLGIRKWLKSNSFKSVVALKSELIPEIVIRMHVFQSEDDKTRVQILFIPHRRGVVSMCLRILSKTVDGSRYITDNQFMPFGAFYPENWYIERRPLVRNFPSLYRTHQQRIENTKEVFVGWDDDAVHDVNDEQTTLERLNTEMGFLNPVHLREEYGEITWEGRYRVWKEYWMLNYFGKPFSY